MKIKVSFHVFLERLDMFKKIKYNDEINDLKLQKNQLQLEYKELLKKNKELEAAYDKNTNELLELKELLKEKNHYDR
jgi:hypothetical protein